MDSALKVAIVSNLGNGQQLQLQQEVSSKEEAASLSDFFTDVSRRQIARVNIPIVEAKIKTLVAQVSAHEATIKLLGEEISKCEASARKNGSGKVYTMDQAHVENLRKSHFENTIKLEQVKIQHELAEAELVATKLDAGVK